MTHHDHSSLVRHWRAQQAMSTYHGLNWKEGGSHVLRSPHDGYLIEVSFNKYEDHPDFTRVRSTNWRAEYEPRGIYHTADARQFYKMLVEAGFVEVKSEPDAGNTDGA